MSDQPTQMSNEDPHPDPFNGNSIRLKVTQEINLGQLQDEITRRVKHEVQCALSFTSATDQVASESNPMVLFVSPGDLNERVVQDVIDKHVPAPTGDRSTPPDAQVTPLAASAGLDTSSLSDQAQPLVEKMRRGETLKTAELTGLLREVLGISTQEQAKPETK